MTLKRRLRFHLACMLAGVAMLGLAAIAGVSALHSDLAISLDANAQLQHVFTVGARVADARARSSTSPAEAAETLAQAADVFDTYFDSPGRWIDGTGDAARAASGAMRRSIAALRAGEPAAADPSRFFAEPYRRLGDLIADTRQAVVRRRAIADAKQRWTLAAVASIAAVILGTAIVVARLQYRSMLSPLTSLRASVGRIASGALDERAAAQGDEEFVALADDLNRMAADLGVTYAGLEARIAAKSRELAQSERLASVGFLAAGVAHEINNPLGIVAGHAERALRRLDSPVAQTAAVRESLEIIRDETFRCKRVTHALLSLARPTADAGDRDACEPVRLDRLVLDVLTTLTALPRFDDRQAHLQADASIDWTLRASAFRLRQVVVNLVLNALEATTPGTGRVCVTLTRRADGGVQMQVIDNGIGMTAELIGRAFEPFFTEKRATPRDDGASVAGAGLGLSIVHSIVASLGGTLRAESAGPTRGSCFTVSLPADRGSVVGARGKR